MQTTVGQRIKFLLDHFQLSARKFSREIGVAENNTQNYLPPSSREPGSKYLELIMLRFESINPGWLLTGQGEPFLYTDKAESNNSTSHNKKISRSLVVGHVAGNATQNQGSEALSDKDALIEQLRSQLADKERMIQLLLSHQPKP